MTHGTPASELGGPGATLTARREQQRIVNLADQGRIHGIRSAGTSPVPSAHV